MYISFYKQKATKAFTFVADKDKNMEESKRQKQVAAVLQDGLNGIFMKLGLSMIDGGLVSLAKVMVTPDLLEARIYISLFQVENPTLALQQITDRGWEIKKMLSEKVKHQLRRIPVLHYYLDDTLDHVFKMEALFAKIQQEKAALLPMKNDLQ